MVFILIGYYYCCSIIEYAIDAYFLAESLNSQECEARMPSFVNHNTIAIYHNHNDNHHLSFLILQFCMCLSMCACSFDFLL